MSFGGGGPDADLTQALDYAWARGSVPVAAGANEPTPSVGHQLPGPVRAARGDRARTSTPGRGLVVTSAKYDGTRSAFAQRTTGVSVAAFGSATDAVSGGQQGILSTWPPATPEQHRHRVREPQPARSGEAARLFGDDHFAYLVGTEHGDPAGRRPGGADPRRATQDLGPQGCPPDQADREPLRHLRRRDRLGSDRRRRGGRRRARPGRRSAQLAGAQRPPARSAARQGEAASEALRRPCSAGAAAIGGEDGDASSPRSTAALPAGSGRREEVARVSGQGPAAATASTRSRSTRRGTARPPRQAGREAPAELVRDRR